jgi:poly-gamma-glutamate synthesis protein (capsule biosynthesis protein)
MKAVSSENSFGNKYNNIGLLQNVDLYSNIRTMALKPLSSTHYKPIRPITFKGKLLVGLVRLLFKIRKALGGEDWLHPLKGHHEDPRKMTRRQQLYFGYKYYFRAILKGDKGARLEQHFQNQGAKFETIETSNSTQKFTLSSGGDLMPYFCITSEQCKDLWKDSGAFFFDADLVVGNLETPLNPNKPASFVPEVMLSNMYFNANQDMFDVFSGFGKYKGYDVLSTANNHSLDQGEEGVLKTIEFLDQKGIAHVGTASSEQERDAFPIIEKNGIRIAFLSYTFSLNALVCPEGKAYLANHLRLNEENPDLSLIVHQAQLARKKGAEFIVAFLHMGCAYQPYPSQTILDNMHKICRQTGIDLVLGGHPHNAQPIEFLELTDPFTGQKKQTTIVYSQGDFVAYDIHKWCKLPLLLKFDIANVNGSVCITDIRAKLFYNHAQIKNGAVQSLKFIDYTLLKANPELLANDKKSRREFEELTYFAETFLLKGNLERFLVKEEGEGKSDKQDADKPIDKF